MSNNRRAGTIYVRVDGERIEAKGSFSYSLGLPKRDAIIGSDGVHGFSETAQVAFIEGATTNHRDLDLEKLFLQDGVTVTLEEANGKVVSLSDAWFAGEGTVATEEGEIAVRWESSLPATES